MENELQIVKVRYIFKDGRTQSAREYTYYSVDRLQVGDQVTVPVRDTFDMAMVTAVDLPAASIELFKDKVKCIQHDSTVAPRRPTVAGESAEPVATRLPHYGKIYLGDKSRVEPFPDNGGAIEPPVPGDAGYDVERFEKPAADGTPGRDDDKYLADQLTVVELPEMETGTVIFYVDSKNYAVVKNVGSDAAAKKLYDEGMNLLLLADRRVITTDADAKLAIDDLAVIASVNKKLDELRRKYEEPVKKHLANFREAFAKLTAPLEAAMRINKEKWGAYRKSVEAAAARAAETNRMAEEVARRQAEASGTGEITVNTAPVEVPKTADTVRANVGTGVAFKTPKYEVVDFKALPDEYKMPDAAKLTRVIKAAKGQITIAGVRIYFEDVLQVRPKGG